MDVAVYDRNATRSARRRASRLIARSEARSHLAFAGLTPRYQPASNPTCDTHHRKLPCKRCASV